jgi:hypothetical protein
MAKLRLATKAGTVVILRTRMENGSRNKYVRIDDYYEHTRSKTKQKKVGITMVNAKKQAVMFVLNLLSVGMTEDEIREKMFTGELEVNQETIDYYRAEKKEPGTGKDIKQAVEERKQRERQAQIEKLKAQQVG